MIDLLLRNLKVHRSATAVIDDGSSLLYGRLDQLSNQFANHLTTQLTASKADGHQNFPQVLPIVAQRDHRYLVAVLACWKLGIGIVPLAVDTPVSRLEQIVSDLGVKQVIALACCDLPANLQVIDYHIENISDAVPEQLVLSADAIAYIIYTSGTTGKPKGCVVGFESLAAIIDSFVRLCGLSYQSRVTFVANIAFDAAMIEWLPAFAVGASVCIIDKDTLLDATALCDFYRHQQITFGWLPTPVAEQLMAVEGLQLPSSLALVMTAGQRLSVRPPAHWHTQVINAYGPTEATVISTAGVVSSQGDSLPDIGQAIDGVECFVVDEQRKVVPQGQAGELLVAGIGVTRGYYRRPELTSEVFFDFVADDGQSRRVYATGDICRVNTDGQIEFIDRKDKQIKLHGFRIEVSDILENLKTIDSVNQVYVSCLHFGGENTLLAHVTLDDGCVVDGEHIKQQVAQLLPYYMVPKHIVVMDSLPLTANQKVDEAALPIPEFVSSGQDNIQLDERQQAFLAIFQHHIDVNIAWFDDVFAAGGNSIALIAINADVYRQFGLTVPFSVLAECRCVNDIYATIGELSIDTLVIEKQMMYQHGYCDAPLSSSQRAIWFMANIDTQDRAYHAKASVRYKGIIDSKAVEFALQKVVERNSIFRTAFLPADGEGVQRVYQHFDVGLAQVDLTELPVAQRELRLDELIQDDFNQPFNLQQLPLVRWALVKMAPNEWVLIHIEHHLVHDGWSYNIFLKEFNHFYRAYFDQTLVSPPVPGQYGDFCHRLVNWLDSDDAHRQTRYWTEQLSDCPTKINLPNLVEQQFDVGQGSTIRKPLSRQTWQAVQQLADERGETPFSVLLSVYYLVLYRYSADKDICVGSAFANRNWVNADSIIGMMINTVVLRGKIDLQQHCGDFLKDCANTVLAAQKHQSLPFEYLVKTLNPERIAGVNPLFQVFFGFHDSPMPSMDLPQVDECEVVEAIGSNAAKFDLSLVVIPREGQQGQDNPVHMLWEFKNRAFPAWLIENMHSDFVALLNQLLAEQYLSKPWVKAQRLPTLEQLTCAQQALLGPVKPVESLSIYQRFSAQAQATPDAVAMVFEQKSYTYAQLLIEVDSIAAFLQSRNIQSHQWLGIHLKRSVASVAWMLACNALGVGYIPLDPEYPVKRIAYIIEHAKMAYIVSSDMDEQLANLGVTRLPVDVPAAQLHEVGSLDMSSPMYCIYTSGSTGKPKGVVISHHAYSNFIAAMAEQFALNHDDAWLALTSFSFDISTLELFLPLTRGATLYLVSQEQSKDVQSLKHLFAKNPISYCQATPSIYRALLDSDWQVQRHLTVLCGGEALDEPLANRLCATAKACYNLYGPTETTVWSSVQAIEPNQRVRLGRPIANTQMYILNEDLQSMPQGGVGRLWIGGESLANGYLYAEDITDQRFIEHPQTRARIYDTGDLATINGDGLLSFHGRADFQVKVSGYRIELGEIEQVIALSGGVSQVACVVRTIANSSQIVAFVVADDVQQVDESQFIETIKQHARQYLSDYMVPKHIVLLPQLPLTPNKKIDRNALPQELDASQNTGVAQQAQTDTEHSLVSIYQTHLGIDTVDVMSHFYQLGGSSLMAMKVCFSIEQQFALRLSVAQLIDLGNIRTIGEYIDDAGEDDSAQQYAEEFSI